MDDPVYHIGDYRDLPMTLGMIIANWNRTESLMRRILNALVSGGNSLNSNLAKILTSNLSANDLQQAITCFIEEPPLDAEILKIHIKHTSLSFDRLRSYRNHYVHGIDGFSQYGIKISDQSLEENVPLEDCMIEGPFAKLWSESARGKFKWSLDFCDLDELTKFNNSVLDFYNKSDTLYSYILHYLHGCKQENCHSLPDFFHYPEPIKKNILSHPKLRTYYALDPAWLKKSAESFLQHDAYDVSDPQDLGPIPAG